MVVSGSTAGFQFKTNLVSDKIDLIATTRELWPR